MSDFSQNYPVTTIHNLPVPEADDLQGRMGQYTIDRPVALVVPALASEMDGPAWPVIMEQLKGLRWVEELVLALGTPSGDDFLRAREELARLPMRSTVVWPGSEGLIETFDGVKRSIDIGPPGKGRDVWIAMGYILGRGGLYAVGLHDADIVTYTGDLAARLMAPLVHPELNYAFCKGYYPRVSEGRLAGRVTRLLVAPLLRILRQGALSATLEIISAMRYPLAGEFALTTGLAGRVPIPRDWGLEVGILSAVSEAVPSGEICQAWLCDNYEHKHQELHAGDTTKGLNRMAVEVSEALLREVGDPGSLEGLVDRYIELAREMSSAYRADALVNGLEYDREKEVRAIETFAAAVEVALHRLDDDQDLPPLPAWEEADRIVPGLMERVVDVVVGDNS